MEGTKNSLFAPPGWVAANSVQSKTSSPMTIQRSLMVLCLETCLMLKPLSCWGLGFGWGSEARKSARVAVGDEVGAAVWLRRRSGGGAAADEGASKEVRADEAEAAGAKVALRVKGGRTKGEKEIWWTGVGLREGIMRGEMGRCMMGSSTSVIGSRGGEPGEMREGEGDRGLLMGVSRTSSEGVAVGVACSACSGIEEATVEGVEISSTVDSVACIGSVVAVVGGDGGSGVVNSMGASVVSGTGVLMTGSTTCSSFLSSSTLTSSTFSGSGSGTVKVTVPNSPSCSSSSSIEATMATGSGLDSEKDTFLGEDDNDILFLPSVTRIGGETGRTEGVSNTGE